MRLARLGTAIAAGAAGGAAVIAWSLHAGSPLEAAVVVAGVWLALPVASIAWAARDPAVTGGGVGDRALATWKAWVLLLVAVLLAIAVVMMPPATSAPLAIARDAALLVRGGAFAAFAVALVPVAVTGAKRRRALPP
jgi:hypothetical protein